MPTTISSNSERRTIATGVVGGALGAFAALMTTWAIGSAASAHESDDATAGVSVRADDVSAGLGLGVTFGDGDATALPTCLPPGDGSGDGSGTGNGDGSGSGDGTGTGSGSGNGSGNGSGSGDSSGSGSGSGNGSGDGTGTSNGSGNGGGLLTGRNLVDASLFTGAHNTWGSNQLLDGAGNVVIGNYPAGHDSLITVDGMVLLDPSK